VLDRHGQPNDLLLDPSSSHLI